MQTRLFAQLNYFEDFLGKTPRRTAAYRIVREDSRSGLTTKIPKE
ncbi:MAG: palindromic element RPE1 domain-containing protein [Holosporaceae bacterium]|nr:palindromic element RPE1 domain-containing protein [Holosporaceae bacterium]